MVRGKKRCEFAVFMARGQTSDCAKVCESVFYTLHKYFFQEREEKTQIKDQISFFKNIQHIIQFS